MTVEIAGLSNPRGEIQCLREKREETRERRESEGQYFSAISAFKFELSIRCYRILYVFFGKGGALINKQNAALVQALNYLDPVVFQKQWSNREEKIECNAS